ncbi:ParA family protein [Candidatus Woesearchaeota archaeon]|nr:ParA family protein [Candidatus Woesearchaeota archaeon]
MRKICIINQKGGVGKTTTTVNLAAGLANKGKRVLLLDLDPQGNVSTCLCARADKNIYHLLAEGENPKKCMVELTKDFHLITSDKTLAKAELILSGQPNRELALRKAMRTVQDYDYVFIDCPPSINLLNQNALLYADEAFIPVSTDYLGLDALKKMVATIDNFNELFEHTLKVTAIIPTLHDKRNKICVQTLNEIKKGYNGIVVEPIGINSKLKEAPSKGLTIFDYAKGSRGAKDYLKLVNTVIEKEFYYA